MSRLPPVEEDDGRHSRQQLITTAGVAGELMAKYAPTHLSAKRKAADLTISESRLSRIKEDDASQSRQEDIPMASVVGKARVDLETEDEISRWEAVSQVDLERMEEGYDDFTLQERSLPELNPTFPVGSKHAPHFQSLRAFKHEKFENSLTDLLPLSLRGVRLRPGVKGFLVEIRPKSWKTTIWLGTYTTAHEAARAYDAGIFYIRRNKPLNFYDSLTSFVAIPPVSLEEAHKSNENLYKFKAFVKEQAVKAARRALDDPEWKRTYEQAAKAALDNPEWKRTYEERYLQMKGKNQNQETSSFESPSYPRLGFGPDFPRTTDGHLKQENQFSRIGISDTTQNCFQTGLQEILTMGRKGKFEGADSIEFLFKQAETWQKL